jgi:hypothetical protein
MRRFTNTAFLFFVSSLLAVSLLACSVKSYSNHNQPSPSLLQPDQASSEPLIPARDSKFAKLKLPLGVSVEVPKNWWIFDSDTNSTIETAAEAAMNLSGIELTKGKQVILFRANSMPKTTYAGIAIKLRDSELDPEILKNASEEEIKEFSPEMNQMMQEGLSAAGLKVIEFYGVRRAFVGKHPALVIEYKRSGQKGDVIVQMTRLFLGEKEILLDLSYRESEAQIWKPIVQYIRKSLTVT